MSAEWPVVELSELVDEITVGFVGSMTKEYIVGGIPFFRSKNIVPYNIDWEDVRYISKDFHKKLAKSTLRPGDVAIVRTGKPGTACVIPDSVQEANCSDIVIARVNDIKLSAHYLAFFMNSVATHQVNSHLVGAVQQHFNVGAAKKIKIPLPSREEQTTIVSVLKTLNDKIELNRQINKTMEEMAQAIFKSWFVDFEPVKAKIEAKESGQDPERAAMCAISGKTDDELDRFSPNQLAQLQGTAALFPDELADSEQGLIPKGWKWSSIGKEVDVVGGGTPSTKNPDFWEGGNVHWTTPKDLSGNQDKILLATDRKITKAGLGKISSGLLPVDTVLLSSRAPVGYLALAKVPVAVNQGYIAMKCTKKLPPVYVLQWASAVMDDIKQRASGTTFAEISKKNFRIIPVLLPTEDLLTLYSQTVNSLYDKITEYITEIRILADLRDTLLPKLLSGEISVADAREKMMKAV